MNKQYCTEVLPVMRKGRTFYTNVFLYPVELQKEDNSSAYDIFGQWSRFELVLLNKSSGTNVVTSINMDVTDVPLVLKKAEQAILKGAATTTAEPASGTLPECFTTKFLSGYWKGKSPAEVWLETPDKTDIEQRLIGQREYLRKALDRFPNNQKIMDAIDQAVSMKQQLTTYSAGAGTASSSRVIIWEAKNKTKAKKNASGQTLVCDAGIYYEDGKFCLHIENSFCFVNKQPDGRQLIDRQSCTDKKVNDMNLSEDYVYGWLTHLDDLRKSFIQSQFNVTYRAVMDELNRGHSQGQKPVQTQTQPPLIFNFGEFKGMTPLQVSLMPNGKERLKQLGNQMFLSGGKDGSNPYYVSLIKEIRTIL